MSIAYVVIEAGWDIIQVFDEQTAAEGFALAHGDATVKAMHIRPDDWIPGEWVRIRTCLALISGGVLGHVIDRRTDFSSEHEGRTTSECRLRPGRWVVTTTGDGACVPQAHADAVALKTDDILGRESAEG